MLCDQLPNNIYICAKYLSKQSDKTQNGLTNPQRRCFFQAVIETVLFNAEMNAKWMKKCLEWKQLDAVHIMTLQLAFKPITADVPPTVLFSKDPDCRRREILRWYMKFLFWQHMPWRGGQVQNITYVDFLL